MTSVTKRTQIHYDKRSKETRTERSKSAAIQLRLENNRIKSLLIESAFQSAIDRILASEDSVRPVYVLDIGCGKGGDLPKWGAISDRLDWPVRYYGIDLSPESIKELQQRFQDAQMKKKWTNLSVEAVVGDMCAPECKDFGSEWPTVDIISSQFSLHYGFDSVGRCRSLFDNIVRFLAHDGQFIVTLIDDALIKQRLTSQSLITTDRKQNAERSVMFGNKIYSISMDLDNLKRLVVLDPINNRCGIKYNFWLDSCIDCCDEFVVERSFLLEMTRRIGLQLVQCKNFGEIEPQNLSNIDEWQVYSLYTAFVFAK